MNKNTIRLRQSELNKIISETLKKVIKENKDGHETYSTDYINVRRLKLPMMEVNL